MIYHTHLDNVLAFCSRETLRPQRIVEEKCQKRLEHQGCVTDRVDSKESTLPWQRRLNTFHTVWGIGGGLGWHNLFSALLRVEVSQSLLHDGTEMFMTTILSTTRFTLFIVKVNFFMIACNV